MSRSSNSYYSQPLLIPDNSVPTTTVVYAIPGIELPPASHSISGNYPYGPRPEHNQCLKYSILLILSVVAIVACGVSVGTPAIWSVTNTYADANLGSVQLKWQTGYFIACSEFTSRFMNQTGCTKYSDVYSYDNEPKYMKASQILGVLSVIFSGITGLIFASLVLCKLLCCNTCGSTCLLLTTVVTQLIALACTISAISVWTVNSTSFLSYLSSTNSVSLDYSAWAGIAGGCIHFIMMISAATLACKQRTY